MKSFCYPKLFRDDYVETIHGQAIPDPYRALENADAQITKQFVKDQNELTESILSTTAVREKFKVALTSMMDYPKYGVPRKEGEYYYYFYNSGLQPQSVMMMQKSLQEEATLFFDPNSLSDDGTTSLSAYSFSESGKLFAYSLSKSGSDWVEIHVLNIDSKEDLEPPLQWVKFSSIEWTHDDKGFFYNRYDQPTVSGDKLGTEIDSNKAPKLYYHRVGTSQKDDIFVYEDEDRDCLISAEVSDDGHFLILYIRKSCDPNTKIWITEIQDYLNNLPQTPSFTKLIDNFEYSYNYLGNDDYAFYFETTLNAPKKRIVKCDIKSASKEFEELVPESKDVVSFSTIIDKDKLILVRLQDVKNVALVFDLTCGKFLFKLPLPTGSMINSLSGKRKDSIMFYSATSFITPGVSWKFDFTTKEQTVYREAKVKGLQSGMLETEQVFFPSKDGTNVPMFLTYKKGMKRDSSNPVLLYAYGGFNHAITPTFSPSWMTFVQHLGGILAIANIRGGSEYGNEWYYGGRLDRKQNCFDDFQYASRYLSEQGYSESSKICANGGSNGGLLVGACANQAPDLFGCCVAEVGVMDMLRFHRYTIGHAWTSDYGNPDLKEDFEVVLKYSPLHNVRKQQYPHYMISTSDHDDRVVPHHSLKLLATLQHVASESKNPIVGRIETKAGHGAGKTTQQRIQEASDKYSFIALSLGLDWKD